MGTFIPSKYQKRIFAEIKNTNNSILINATAGSGKTTTLIKIPTFISGSMSVIFLAFNKSIATELKTRLPDNVHCSTIHSFGCSLMYKNFAGIVMDENKAFKAAKHFYRTQWVKQTREKEYTYAYKISRLVELMQLTLTPDDDDEAINNLAAQYDVDINEDYELDSVRTLYQALYKDTGRMSFNDMVFQPSVRNIRIPRYDVVLVDETQDLNRCHQTLVRKMLHPTHGRLIAVGDPAQSIYGFGGADFKSWQRMSRIVPTTIELPLSICYRCAKNIVAEAKKIVPVIEAAETAELGIVRRVDQDLSEVKSGDFVICRNTRPLIVVFKWLVARGIKAHIKGREIGRNLIVLIEKTKKSTIAGVLTRIEDFKEALREKLIRQGYPRPDEHIKMLQLLEKRDIILLLSQIKPTVEGLKQYIAEIFIDNDEPGVTLSTIHRVKGLEADRVWFLNRDLIPSQYARTEEDFAQEEHCLFVALTRARKELIYLNYTDERSVNINEIFNNDEEEDGPI